VAFGVSARAHLSSIASQSVLAEWSDEIRIE
jgi:hypothetical protein